MRTSGRNADAEKRRRNASVAPAAIVGPHAVNSAAEWNNGIDAYVTSDGTRFSEPANPVAMRSRRSCEHTTAFGAPVVPDVNSRKI